MKFLAQGWEEFKVHFSRGMIVDLTLQLNFTNIDLWIQSTYGHKMKTTI